MTKPYPQPTPGILRVAAGQIDCVVGDIDGNTAKVIECSRQAAADGVHLIVFPELTITGYPPEDLVYRNSFLEASDQAIEKIRRECLPIDMVIGHPWRNFAGSEAGEIGLQGAARLHNAVSWISGDRLLGRKAKEALPNYAVFDERRYFDAGDESLVVEIGGVKVGVLVCEDFWAAEPIRGACEAGAEMIVVSNASPFHVEKQSIRERLFAERAQACGAPTLYVNTVGGQDELVFDGQSAAVQCDGTVASLAPAFADVVHVVDFDPESLRWREVSPTSAVSSHMELAYGAMVRGTGDYVRKNGFTDVVLGLSGGIDSAICLAIAVDALGADHVYAVMLPSEYTSDLSLELAKSQAEMLGVDYQVIGISETVDSVEASLGPVFAGTESDTTEENLQSRTRGMVLMALSNKFGWMLLTTGNKSEYAVGYATIYGDMAGGFAPIKDCAKTRVFDICRWLNRDKPTIVQGIIDRPPSAELRHDQKDSDSLPPYEILDEVIARYVELDQSVATIVEAGFDRDIVERVARLIHFNEWKRRQSAPGTRITPRAFGRDRRYPITNLWRA